MFRILFLLGFVLASAATLLAHPPIGIVEDSGGNVFYSDLENVWKISRDGKRSVVVAGVHTHELYLDSEDNLFGEHLWYEGDRTGRWGHYVWRLSRTGRLTRVIPAQAGFLTNYSFVRDRSGTMYWPDRERSRIMKRLADGRITVHAAGRFRDIRWMHSTPQGVLHLVDDGNLLRIQQDGSITKLGTNLRRTSLLRPHARGRHNLMGVWTDARGGVYLAVHGGGVVLRFFNGEWASVAQSPRTWGPSGGTFSRNGDLLLLETSLTNAVRVRRIAARDLR